MMTRFMTIAVIGLCGLLMLGGCYNPPVERHKSRQAIDAGNYAEADRRLAELRNYNPADWEAHYLQGLSYLAQGRPVQAQSVLEQALAANDRSTSNTPKILDALAESMLMQENYEQLYAFLDAQIDRYETWQDYARKARLLAMANDIDGAALAYRQAAYFSRNQTEDIYVEIADFYAALGDNNRAVQALRWAYYINDERSDIESRFLALDVIPGPTTQSPPPQPEYAGARIFELPQLISD